MQSYRHAVRYLRKNFDSLAILALLGKIAAADSVTHLSDDQLAVLAALKRSNSQIVDSEIEEVAAYLSSLDEDQVPGLVSNIKGVLHEMEFVKIENTDGDNIVASYFKNTNHPDYDIQLTDAASGESWLVQLKASDQAAYVQEWMDDHPRGEIVVTEELADRMDLPSSGMSNDELTADVSDFVDSMVAAKDEETLWTYFPELTAVSASLVIWELWKRHERGELTLSEFKWMAAKATGAKATKIAGLTLLLGVPVVGQVTGAVLIAQVLFGARELVYRKPTVPQHG